VKIGVLRKEIEDLKFQTTHCSNNSLELRDYFAGQYSLRVDKDMIDSCYHREQELFDFMAKESYKYADTMITERMK
jgi:hypothetical protein